jgi:hypothetical protein
MFTPTGEHSVLFMEKNGGVNREFHPPRDNFTPRGQNSSLVENFAPEDKI